MKNLFKSKKAQQINYFAVLIFLILFGFFNIIAYTIYVEFITAITNAGYNSGQVATTLTEYGNALRLFDWLIVLVMVGLIIGIGVTSYRLATSPIFFLISFVMGLFWGFVSYFFNYIFIQLVTPAVLQTSVAVFPRTMIMLTNLHWVMVIMFVVGSITLYGKKEKGQYLT
mgnify:CR=1 FL=1